MVKPHTDHKWWPAESIFAGSKQASSSRQKKFAFQGISANFDNTKSLKEVIL